MTFPSQTLTVRDPGLGISPPVANIPVLTGIAHGGSTAVNVLTSIGSLSQVRSVVGYGPLAEDVALALQLRGGPVYFIIHNSVQNVALSAQALTKLIGTGPTITATGSPNDRYALRVVVVAGGTLGTSTFKFSLDAHDADYVPFTFSDVRPTVASYVVPNSGLTLTMPAGTYVAGDTYTLACVPQEPGTTDLALVAAVLQAATLVDFHLWAVSGSQPDDVTGAAFAVALSGYLTSLTSSFRYVRGLCDVGSDDTSANILIGAATWTSSRVCPAYGYELILSALPFEGFSTRKVSCVASIAARAFGELISSDLSRTAAGSAENVRKIYFDGFATQTLDAAKISTMRTWPAVPGYFIANAKLKSSFGSDFIDLQYGRVMDVACSTTYAAQFPFQSASLRTISAAQASAGRPAGAIDERDAREIEKDVQNALDNNLTRPANASGNPGHVSALSYTVDLSVDIVTTGQLKTTVALQPLGYAKVITTDLFFTLNP